MGKDKFWDYYSAWQTIFKKDSTLLWEKNWLENGLCKDCRYCCGPQGSDAPFPMGLLKRQIDQGDANNFYMLDSKTAYIGAAGCKSNTPDGCRLNSEQKPVACGLFPIVLVNGSLYLYQMCPAVLSKPLCVFLDLAQKAADMLVKFKDEDLKNISINLSCDELQRKYINLHITIFE